MPSRKKTSKAFKSLKKDKFSKDSLAGAKAKAASLSHLLQLQQQQKNKRKKTDLAALPASAAFNHQISELEARKNGKKRVVAQTAKVQVAPGTFSFTPKELKPDIMFADSLIDDDDVPEKSNNINKAGGVVAGRSESRVNVNRFDGLLMDDDEEEPEVKPAMALQPATFSFARPEQKLEDDDDDI